MGDGMARLTGLGNGDFLAIIGRARQGCVIAPVAGSGLPQTNA